MWCKQIFSIRACCIIARVQACSQTSDQGIYCKANIVSLDSTFRNVWGSLEYKNDNILFVHKLDFMLPNRLTSFPTDSIYLYNWLKKYFSACCFVLLLTKNFVLSTSCDAVSSILATSCFKALGCTRMWFTSDLNLIHCSSFLKHTRHLIGSKPLVC